MALGMEEFSFNKLFSQPHNDDVRIEVIRQILFSYGRSRGKDFVRKVNAKVGAKYHKTFRSTLGTAAAIVEKKTKEAKDKEEQSPCMKYLLKQQKKDLVQASVYSGVGYVHPISPFLDVRLLPVNWAYLCVF